jgi:para-aminobenzoate synthetase component I
MPLHEQECIAGAGVRSVCKSSRRPFLNNIGEFVRANDDWIFGHMGYALKSETVGVSGGSADPVGFDPAFFFIPLYIIIIRGDELKIGSFNNDHEEIYSDIVRISSDKGVKETIVVEPKISKREYVDIVEKLRGHILRGDCYEINFCQEFFAKNCVIDPVKTFRQLARVSPNPFSAFYRIDEHYLLCASPERFLKKTGNQIVSQPIKGTIQRNLQDEVGDELLREELFKSAKDRSENVMVVDLVRNDLSKVCKKGTVKVDELFGIYAFPQVHQMVSTISGELDSDKKFEDIMQACFPMGSMTGAPKKKVLELIDRYESTGRGLFSGSVGYITPEKDFDFNVVIRSLFYNSVSRYLSYLVGSGITFYSDPEKEYEECLLKAAAMEKALK